MSDTATTAAPATAPPRIHAEEICQHLEQLIARLTLAKAAIGKAGQYASAGRASCLAALEVAPQALDQCLDEAFRDWFADEHHSARAAAEKAGEEADGLLLELYGHANGDEIRHDLELLIHDIDRDCSGEDHEDIEGSTLAWCWDGFAQATRDWLCDAGLAAVSQQGGVAGSVVLSALIGVVREWGS